MSAYMPVKRPILIAVTKPSGAMALRAIIIAVLLALAAGIICLLFAAVRIDSLKHLPSGTVGSVAARGATAARDHGFLVVQGEAFNTSDKPARNMLAVIEVFDEAGNLRGVESALVEGQTITSHGESPFVVRLPDPGNISSYRIRFRSMGSSQR
jgi:hypothetical protein